MKKDKRTTNLLPWGTFFYMLPFGDSGQSMTREMLFPHFQEAEAEKQNIEDRLELQKYDNGILTAIVYLNDGSVNSICLYIGLEGVYIACSCGMPGKKLCRHSFVGLQKIIGHGSFDFGMYFWPDIETDEKLRRKFLNIEISHRRIFVEPGYRYGRMFKPGVAFGRQLIFTKKLTRRYNKREMVAVGYCLVYTVGFHHSSHLHMLMPFLVLTGKDGHTLVGFKQFIKEDDSSVRDVEFTKNQLSLNKICFAQYDSAMKYESLTDEERIHELLAHKEEMFALWQQAIPLLRNESHCYSFCTEVSWLKDWDKKPKKSKMERCNYGLERPVVSFSLKLYGDHFIIFPTVRVNGAVIKPSWLKVNLFMYDEVKELIYLMASVQDDELLIWLSYERYRITILKVHFREFHETFLARLTDHYEVLFSHSGSKKMIPYDFGTVMKSVG